MAVATQREYGLFINGELVEPASGEIRDLAEPATGDFLGRAVMAGDPPPVLAGVVSPMSVAQEEIFGPVVTVIPFEDEKDAIRIANDVRYGLMATVWTGDAGRGYRVASRIKAGGL